MITFVEFNKKCSLTLLCTAFFTLALCGQGAPRWVSTQSREYAFPDETYITGFAEGNIRKGETQQDAAKRLKKEAQGLLTESIRVMVESLTESKTISVRINQSEELGSTFESAVKTAAKAEIVGIKTDTYYADDEGTMYAFAYANKLELAKYYQSQISLQLQKAEGALVTASQMISNGAKVKARKQCEEAIPLLAKVAYAQDLLTAVDKNADDGSWQGARTEAVRNEVVQMLAQLEQGVYVYVESKEDIFGESPDIIGNRIQSILSNNNCSFTNDPTQADFRLYIVAKTIPENLQADGNFVHCRPDVRFELLNNYTQKKVSVNKLSLLKGSWKTRDMACRKAFEKAADMIWTEIEPKLKGKM